MEQTQKIHTQAHHQRQNLSSDSSKVTHRVRESQDQILCRNNGGGRGRHSHRLKENSPNSTSGKVIFQTQRQIETFSDKQRLKEFTAWGPALQKNTKGRPSG